MSRSWCITTKHQSSLFLLSLNSVRRNSSKYSYAFFCLDTWLTLPLVQTFLRAKTQHLSSEPRRKKRVFDHTRACRTQRRASRQIGHRRWGKFTGIGTVRFRALAFPLGLSMHLTHFCFPLQTGIIGDVKDINRRKKLYYKIFFRILLILLFWNL